MPLASGTRLGPYEILAPLGAGGMGEVYRARDTRLDRTVAIKILPAQFSTDPVRKQRFEREAKTISSLNHPHICVLYDVGSQDGVDYLVMECMEGETLAKRLEKGALPLEQVLKLGTQIADALDKAHRSGVIHRDVKPGNIMLTPTGAKLLDFGLAKPASPLTSVATLTAAVTQSSPMTEQGAIVGTFQYMSPEQVEGKELDGRSDIFSLGAVLHEMLTGQRAFPGKSQLSVASAILEKEPAPISAIKPLTPPALDHTIRRCLVKDPEERWQTARDLASELQWITESGSLASGSSARVLPARQGVAWAAAATLLIAAGISTAAYYRLTSKPDMHAVWSYILPAENTSFYFIGGRAGSAVISPDGRRLAFTAITTDGKQLLWVRPLNAASSQPLAGTEGAAFPFWSPDSRMLGFFAQGALKKIDAGGGPVQALAGAPLGRGGSWASDGTIIFTPSTSGPIYRVSANGGQPTAVTKLEDERQERSHRWPYFLPDGRHFLFLSRLGAWESKRNSVFIGSLDSAERQQVLNVDTSAIYAPPGFLLYLLKDGTLMAQPFDARRMEKRGEAFPIAERVLENQQVDLGIVSASANGTLIFQPVKETSTRLRWLDRSGKQTDGLEARSMFAAPALSPDGRRVAVDIFDPSSHTTDIWIYELARNLATRFTFGPGDSTQPIWSPDGEQIVFSCERDGYLNLCVKPSNGTGEQQVLSSSAADERPTSWLRDGRYIAYSRLALPGTTRSDVWILPLFGDRKPFPFLHSPVEESDATFSPDAKWMAYMSYESGRNEVYITSFPMGDSKWQVSTSGGREPRWRPDGKELFYFTSDNVLTAVEIRATASGLELGAGRPLFAVLPGRGLRGTFAVAPDGQHFLVNTISDEKLPPLMLVTNWATELKK